MLLSFDYVSSQQLDPPLQLRNTILGNRNVILPRSLNLAMAHLIAQQMRRDIHVSEVSSVGVPEIMEFELQIVLALQQS